MSEQSQLSLRFDAEANPVLVIEATGLRLEAPISELAPVLAHPGVVLELLAYSIGHLDDVAPDARTQDQLLTALRTVVAALESHRS